MNHSLHPLQGTKCVGPSHLPVDDGVDEEAQTPRPGLADSLKRSWIRLSTPSRTQTVVRKVIGVNTDAADGENTKVSKHSVRVLSREGMSST